jgi:predicted phage terminase large subunit-like protein
MPDSATLTELTESLRYCDAHERAELDRLLEAIPPTLTEFVEATFAHPLFAWQHLLCERLQRLAYEQGQRILIHAPPQTGKSLVVSQRLPAYLIGCNPATRVKLACYNVTHATRFSKINLQLMQERVYQEMFPDPGCRLGAVTQEEWTTVGRARVRDAQPSFMALGLRTGMVGQGCDTLIMDDPYSSPAEAFSEVINNGVWDFWTSAAKVRLSEEANVVVMFHRYHCLTPKCGIITDMGLKHVCNLQVGDRVLTSQGVLPVLAVGSRHHNGDILKIRIYGYPEPLEVTPEHQLLSVEGWKESRRLRVGDWMVFPIPACETSTDTLRAHMPAAPAPKAIGGNKITGAKSRVDRDELTRLYSEGLTCKQIAERFGFKSSQAIQRYVSLWGLNKPAARVLDPECVMDADFWRVVGYWLAEGCFGGQGVRKDGYVRWTFSRKEWHLVEDIYAVLARYGIPVTHYEAPGVYQVQASSKQLAGFLAQFGRGARNKYLPEWAVLLPVNFAKECVRGYVAGDGYILDSTWVRVTSVSLQMLIGFQRLLLRLGVVAAIMVGSKQKYELRFPLCQAKWLSNEIAQPVETRFAKIVNGMLQVRIKGIEIEEYQGEVWDIKTPSHDFLSHGLTVHNCDDLAGRMFAEGDTHSGTGPWEMWRFPAEGDDNPQMPDRFPRRPGEPLTPRLTPAFIAEQKKVPSVWLGQFQGLPVAAGGNLFKRAWFHYYQTLPPLKEVWSVTDTALKAGQQNDETANLIMGLGEDGNLYILRATHGHWETPDFARFLVAQADWLRRTYADRFKGDFIEDKVSGTTLMQYVRRSSPQTILIGVAADSDKVARAHGVTPVVEAGRVHLPDPDHFPAASAWVRYFLDQVTSFPGGLDDLVDTFCYALKRFLGTLRTTGSRKGKTGGYLG